MGVFFVFFLGVIITLIMLALFGFMVMYFVMSLKLIRLGNKEENFDKKRSGQKSLLWAVSGMVLVFIVWLFIMSFFK